MKKFVTFVLLLGLGLFTFGCGGSSTSTPAKKTPGQEAHEKAGGGEQTPAGDTGKGPVKDAK